MASLKLGVGELGGFTGSGTRRLGPPALFPEPGATPPAPAGAAVLGSFLERGQEWAHKSVLKGEMDRKGDKGKGSKQREGQQTGSTRDTDGREGLWAKKEL